MWKKINDEYSVSREGNIRNDKSGRILKQDLNSKGYYRIQLNGYHPFVHRLVAIAFIDNPNNYPQVNHKDCNPLNNNVDNLEWCTNQYNNEHSYLNGRISGRTRVCKKDLQDILQYLADRTYTVKELAKMYNVSTLTIHAYKQGLNLKRLSL